VLVVGGRAPPEPPLDRLAELRQLGGRLSGKWRGAQAARRDVSLDEPVRGGLALPRCGVRDTCAELDLRAFERDLEARVQLSRTTELLRGRVGMALGQRRLPQRVGERR
jgi:hypothetical protein